MRLLIPAMLLACAAFAQQKTMTVTGKLGRAMAIGGETTGWSIQLDSPVTIEGKQRDSLEVAYSPGKLNALNNQHVRASGHLAQRQGVETGSRPVLEITTIEKAEAASGSGPGLTGTEWVLEDIAGKGVIDNAQATLSFLQNGRVAGRGSCNRFSGPVEISGANIKFGPLISTRMACPEAVMNQETKYFNALQGAAV